MTKSIKYWAVVPAAGVGSRMQADVPKQYLLLNDKPVIEHSLSSLANHAAISAVVVSVSATDELWPALNLPPMKAPVWQAEGGAERCHSVLNGLHRLSPVAADDDWVLVHDAARPCLRSEDIDRLIDELSTHECGGLLGLPVADTMKRSNAQGGVLETVSREQLWRALTPQMFRLGALRQALEQALLDEYLVTDEASAMEHSGFQPQMVEGHGDNIKITRPQDLALAAMYLNQQRDVE